MDKDLIKSVLLDKGWRAVEAFLMEEFKHIIIDTEKSVEEIGKQYLAKEMAQKALTDAIGKLRRMAQEQVKKDIKYK